MRKRSRIVGGALFLLLLGLGSSAYGQTTQDFDSAGSPYQLTQYSGSPGPFVQGGGPTGNFLRLAASSTGLLNSIGFDRTDTGAFCDYSIEFDFRITPGSGSAEGFGVALFDTSALQGEGTLPTAEEPSLAFSLGVGFDVSQGGGGDLNDNHVSIHFAGTRFLQVDATPILDLDATSGQFVHAQIDLHADGVDADISVILTPPGGSPTVLVDEFAVPGLKPYEARLHFGAATGGSSDADHDIDNVNVSYTGCPSILGQWGGVVALPIIGIHSAMLKTGKVIIWDRDDQLDDTPYLIDPVTEVITPAADPAYNLFCAGHSFLPDGRLFVSGGHTVGDRWGLDVANIYDPVADSWVTVSEPMNAGRWYPSHATLANGDQLVIAGNIEPGVHNPLPQVYEVATDDFRDLTNAMQVSPWYPYVHLLPDGRVFMAGPDAITQHLDTSGTGAWTVFGNTIYNSLRDTGSSVNYDHGKIMIVGGGFSPPTATAEIIDFYDDAPAWQSTGSMRYARRHMDAVMLADGQVLVAGGTLLSGFNDPEGSVYAAEKWDPQTGNWTTMAGAQIERLYHSYSLLLPDGRVMVGSGGHPPGGSGDEDHFDFEIYSPPYLFLGPKPTITSAPAQVGRGGSFLVETPDASSVARVHLIRLSSTTHGFNMTQLLNPLDFVETSAGLVVEEPIADTLAPSGPYMLFLISDAGVPSVSAFMDVVETPTLETLCSDDLDNDGDGLPDCFDRDCHGTASCPATVLIQAGFDSGPDGFVYVDDAFRSTGEPVYASGAELPAGGFSGGGLGVTLGGIDSSVVTGMSGAWQRSFTLAVDSEVQVSFRYDLTQSAEYDPDERSQVMVTVDAARYGTGALDFVAQIAGNGAGGGPITTGWQLFTASVGPLPAGTYQLRIGGFNNKKATVNSYTDIALDDISVSFFATPDCGDGMVTGSEECDGGDCCSLACTFEIAGTSCTDDGNVCTDDVCDAVGVCTHPGAPLNGFGCDDMDACTFPDTCMSGSCLAGPPLVCDDLDTCTADSCDSISACVFTPIFECCGDGVIEGSEECDDANLDPSDGCSATCTVEPDFSCEGEPSVCHYAGLPISDWVAPLLALLIAGSALWVFRAPGHPLPR